MSIAEKLTTVAENVPKVYEAGQKTEWDSFWEELQSGGSAMNYYYAFCYNRFNDKNFNPKYPIRCTNGNTTARSIFYYNTVLTDTKVELIASSNNMNYCFQGASALKTIRTITVKETTAYTSTFDGCEALKNITFNGTIGKDISFSASPLTVASMKNIITHLKNYVGTSNELSYTLSFSSSCWKALEANSTSPDGTTWKEYVQFSLGWNV